MIKRSIHTPQSPMRRSVNAASITAGVQNRRNSAVNASVLSTLNPAQKAFVAQLRRNCTKPSSIMAATNTTNIAARPDFLELLPIFVQKLLLLDVYGSVAMRSRQQLIPYFKFIAENDKGETHAGDVLSSPFVNHQGVDPNFTGRVIKNEIVEEGTEITTDAQLAYGPVLPGSVTLSFKKADGTVTKYVDNGAGKILQGAEEKGEIDYALGTVTFSESLSGAAGDSLSATYQYDNENVGPHPDSLADSKYGYGYGAQMGKGYLQLDEINLIAEAKELACYWSVYSAFAAETEYGGNVGDIAKEAAFSEITAEINHLGFEKLRQAATFMPQFNWDAAPVLSSSVVPSDYLNMFKLKLSQAAAAIYQRTHLSKPNRLIVGTNVAAYISMINTFKADTLEDTVGPYKYGQLDQFTVYVDPYFEPNTWVLASKSSDIRRCSGLFGEYMPLVNTTPVSLANASVQSGFATMIACEVVNPASVATGKITGTF